MPHSARYHVHRGDHVVSFDGYDLGYVSGVSPAAEWFTVDTRANRIWLPESDVFSRDGKEVRLSRNASMY